MPDLSIEQQFKNKTIAGVDEVGRGCIAGCVVAAAVILPNPFPENLQDINDSKKLPTHKRAQLFQLITSQCQYAIGRCSEQEIDQLNILQASLLAMQQAVDGLPHYPDVALIDGHKVPLLKCHAVPIIQGDSKSLSIAAASIVAKVYRDQLMQDLALQYPNYDWQKNKGYPSKAHKLALLQHGLTPYHRLSFAPCKILKAG